MQSTTSVAKTLFDNQEGPARLYLWLPNAQLMTRALMPTLAKLQIPYTQIDREHCLVIDAYKAKFETLLRELGDLLQPKDASQIKALILFDQVEPQMADFPKVTTLQQLISAYQARYLVEILSKGSTTCHFQPIVHANDTARVFGYEALMRGVQKDFRLIPPTTLLAYAREAGLTFMLDQHARRTALQIWQQQQIDAPVFINFSHSTLANSKLCLKSVLKLLGELNMSPQNVIFEIVESEAIENVKIFKRVLAEYREAGLRIALDDTGSGYSSLNMLHQLQPEFLKIDMDLVRKVHELPYKATVTRKLIELGRELGITTIAEGVENLEELAWLRTQGVDMVQGYLIAKPTSQPPRTTSAIETDAQGASVRIPSAE